MKQSRHVILVALVWSAVVGVACTQKAANEALDAAKAGTATAIDETQEALATTGEVITDAWITAKVSAKFVDEVRLNGSSINVDTDKRVVTLRGTVASAAAKSLAEAIASGTEGVTRVVNQLSVT
jgi:osmotically-inducible protein OsmY